MLKSLVYLISLKVQWFDVLKLKYVAYITNEAI